MAIDAGSVLLRLGAKFDETGFRRYDQAMEKARRERDLKAELGGDFNPHAFRQYESALDKAKRSVAQKEAFKAQLGADYNPAAFRAYQRDVDRAERQTRGLDGSTDRLGKSHSRLVGVVGRSGVALRAVGTGAAAGAVGVGFLGKTFVGTASDINESLTKNETLFGRHARAIDRWSDDTAKSLGISRANALAAAGSFGSLFETIGTADRPAANMSRRLVTLAADLASFNNATPEEALEALRSGLIGEAEPMRRFGVLLSETRVKTEAYKSGIADAGAELTEQQKVQARYQLILKDGQQAQGDFTKTSGGMANQMRILRAQASDLGARVGEKLIPVVIDVTKFLNRLFGDTDKGGSTLRRLQGRVSSVGDTLSKTFAVVLAEGRKLITGVTRSFRGVEDDLKEIGEAIAAVWGFILASLRRSLPGIRKALTGLADMVRGVVQIIAGILTLDFGRAWDGVKNIFGGAIEAILGLLRAATAPFREIAVRIGNAIKRPLLAAIDFIIGGFTTILNIAARMTGAFGWVPGVGGNMKKAAGDIDDARDSIDKFRESLRQTDREQRRQTAIKDARKDVRLYRDILKETAKGSEGYRQTAEKLDRAQEHLNKVTARSKPASDRAGKGFRALGDNVDNLGVSVSDVATYVLEQTNDILQEFGARRIKQSVKRFHSHQRGPGFSTNRGGGIIGYKGGGTVPSLVSPGELLIDPSGAATTVPGPRTAADSVFANLRKGTAVLTGHGQQLLAAGASLRDAVSRQLPHFAGGGFAGMIGAANRVDRAHFPYLWGGGHQATPAPFGKFDCSGAVSYVLQQGGIGIPTMTSGSMMGIGKPGEGQVTLFANPGHVFMRILGRYFGTSGENPGGGAGWFSGGGDAYQAGFVKRHFGTDDIGAAIGQVARLIVSGGTNTTRRIVQGPADRMVKAANRYLSRQTLGGGDPGDAGPGTGVNSVGEFVPFWNKINPDLRQWAQRFGVIVSKESGFNPRAENHIGLGHRGWYQYDPPTWSQFGQGPWDNAFSPALSTQATGNALRREGSRTLSRWAETAFSRGGIQRFRRGGWGGGSSPHSSPGFGGVPKAGTKSGSKLNKVIEHIRDRIKGLGDQYDLKSRRFDFTEEEFVNEGDEDTPPSLNQAAIKRRSHELDVLIGIRRKMAIQYGKLVTYLTNLNNLWRQLIRRLEGSIGRAQERLKHLGKGKEAERTRKTLEGRIAKWNDRLTDLRPKLEEGIQSRQEASFDWQSTKLDVQELRNELAPLLGGGKGIELPDWEAPLGDTGAGGDAGEGEPAETAPTPEQIAAAAREQLRSFTASRAELFGSFGQNFVKSGQNPFGSELGQAAGMRFFGAGAGSAGVIASSGGKVITTGPIIQHFPQTPDPMTWSRGLEYELGAL